MLTKKVTPRNFLQSKSLNMTNNKKQILNNAANITSIANKRVEKNLKALKLLQENDV